ncbi:MAG TPA: histidine phosphatase family protein [Longimicrobiales bacterium]|nr:histidine phosphatase family protein [Longimicrobiales bacterium]
MKRSPEMGAIAKTVLMVVAFLLVAAAHAAAQSTTVVVVRHAEKLDDSADPLLSDAGTARAQALAAALANADVAAVITTQFHRTRLTGQPMAEKNGLTTITVPAANPLRAHLDGIVAKVKEHAGRTVLVVGHSNTVPLIVRALGGPDVGAIADSEYADMFTLVIDGDKVRLVRSKY